MVKITVHMTKEALFDFLLYHAYSKFSGFLTNVLGMAVLFMGIILFVDGKINQGSLVFYLMAGLLFLSCTPIQLLLRAKKQVSANWEYCHPVQYTFSEEGIFVAYQNKTAAYSWEKIERAVVTPKTIGIYHAGDRALILPKKDFGEQFVPAFTAIAKGVGKNRLQLR